MARSFSVLAFTFLLAGGCTLQLHGGSACTVVGPALVSETRIVRPDLRRAARVLSIRAFGLAPSAGGPRIGLSAGACRDTRFEVYAYDELTPELRAWIEGAAPVGRALVRARDVPSLWTSYPPPPGTREIARFYAADLLGGGLNVLDAAFSVSAGLSASRRLRVEPDADMAVAYSPDGTDLVILSVEGDP